MRTSHIMKQVQQIAFFTLIISFLPFSAIGQDLIVTEENDSINGTITDEGDYYIYYLEEKNDRIKKSMIN